MKKKLIDRVEEDLKCLFNKNVEILSGINMDNGDRNSFYYNTNKNILEKFNIIYFKNYINEDLNFNFVDASEEKYLLSEYGIDINEINKKENQYNKLIEDYNWRIQEYNILIKKFKELYKK